MNFLAKISQLYPILECLCIKPASHILTACYLTCCEAMMQVLCIKSDDLNYLYGKFMTDEAVRTESESETDFSHSTQDIF